MAHSFLMRICVLGATGMLGHVVTQYFTERGCHVYSPETRFSMSGATQFIGEVKSFKPQWCVNCVGVKPAAGTDERCLYEINALLPERCAEALWPDTLFLHASSDGVFRDDKENRLVTEIPDAADSYGRSKLQGERAVLDNAGFVIRCSIVGPELENRRRSLMSWLLSCTGTVPGYENQSWNGITTLEWARIAFGVLSGAVRTAERIVQPGLSKPVTKACLLRGIAAEWNVSVQVVSSTSNRPVTRTLVPNILSPELGNQLADLRRWYNAAFPKETIHT